MSTTVQHQPQAATAEREKAWTLDDIIESTKTRSRVTPFLKNESDYPRVAAAVRLAAQANPDILRCTPASIQQAVVKVAQWGLEIGETAHLVPFNVNVAPKGQPKRWEKRLTAIADYRGLIQLMIASSAVRHVEVPRIVYANELFEEVLGSNASLAHQPIHDAEARGKMVGVYVFYRLRFGIRDWYYMTLEEVEAIRQGYSKQWKDGEMKPWYMRKTVIRQMAKYVPKDPRLAKALAVVAEDETQEFGQELDEVIAETQRQRKRDEDEMLSTAAPTGEQGVAETEPNTGEEPQDDRWIEERDRA